MTFNHLFDSSALLHRFGIQNGRVTYQCRFLKTNSFKKNHVAQRIVVRIAIFKKNVTNVR